MSKLLGGVDWIELHEPSNNHRVYISLSTGVTSEKKPLNVDIKNANEFEWWELLDTKSNRFYYFNTRNKQTTWIRPKSNSIIPFGNVQIPVDDLADKLESQCLSSDQNLHSDQDGLSSTPSVKHRPFPRTNPRSVPRRCGSGADSPITLSQMTTNRNSCITDSSADDSFRRRLGNSNQHVEEHCSSPLAAGHELSNRTDKMLSSHQRCQSRSSLSSSGTETTMNIMFGQVGRPGRAMAADLQGQNEIFNPELSIDTSLINSNGGSTHNHQGMSLPNTMNGGYPVYDYPPSTNNAYYSTSNNYSLMQQQAAAPSGRILSPSSTVSQPEAFYLRRPQSEQAIGSDNNKQRMTMVSPRSDIIPGITQSNRYYPNTTGWVERSFSPTPFIPVFPQYPGPLPGWNSELFRKDQAPAKLLNWCKDCIQKPLLMSTDKILKSDACQAFKQIQGYMGDRKSKHSPTELVNSIIQKGANYYPLRDEIFMQICKQTTNNPDELSTLRGWELLGTCLNYFAPSTMFRPYLEGYVLRHLDNNHNNECPTPPKIQQAADQTLQLLLRQTTNAASRFDPALQYQYHQQQLQLQQQQQQQMMMMANMQTVSNHKNSIAMNLFEPVDGADDSDQHRCLPLGSHFGYTLDDIMRAQYLKFPDRELPWVLVTLCEEIIRRNGDRTEGIFRLEADSSSVQALCTVLDLYESVPDHPLTSNNLSPHTPASSIKHWLDSLLEPLVAPSLCNGLNGRTRTPMDVYQSLSRIHQVTLMYLVRFLQLLSIDENIRHNRMGPYNLAVALVPHVFQMDPGSGDGAVRVCRRGVDTTSRSDTGTNDSSGSSSKGGEDGSRVQVNFLYQLIVGLDTGPLDGVV